MAKLTNEYFLSFKTPMKIGQELLSKKRVQEFQINNLIVDYSPLCGLNQEDFDHEISKLKSLTLNALPSSLDQIKEVTKTFSPSMRFSLECLFLENLIEDKNEFSNNEIKENALFIPGKTDPQQSHDCIKVKIARRPIEDEIELVNKLSENKILRLDANKSLTSSELSYFWNNLLHKENIQYFEDPLIDSSELKRISHEIPLALDESLCEYENNLQANMKYIVLKPSVKKAIVESLEFINEMNKQGVKVVISSAFETPRMMRYLYYLANYQNNYSETFHGLDTLKFFDI